MICSRTEIVCAVVIIVILLILLVLFLWPQTPKECPVITGKRRTFEFGYGIRNPTNVILDRD